MVKIRTDRQVNGLIGTQRGGCKMDSLMSLNEYGESGPCLGTVWADTDNPVYRIEMNDSAVAGVPAKRTAADMDLAALSV